jgi:hypothetical protein
MMDRLIELEVDPKAKLNDGWTALHLAAENDHVAMVNRLLSLGADDAPDRFGFTALHKAIYRFEADVVRALVNAKGNFGSLDPYGYSPLEWASRTPELYYDLQVLLQKLESPTEAIRRATRKSSILKAIEILRQCHQEPHQLYTLGHFLLFDGDESNACFAFIQNAQLENGSIKHKAHCNLCAPNREKKILGTRYICRRCPEVDLCHSCMESYRKGVIVTGCHDHDFLSISQAETDDSITEFDSIQKSSLDEWLEQLWTTYETNT